MLNKVWFRTGVALLILFLLIKLIMEVHSVFTPIATIIGSVFLPFILSGFYFIFVYHFKHYWKNLASLDGQVLRQFLLL